MVSAIEARPKKQEEGLLGGKRVDQIGKKDLFVDSDSTVLTGAGSMLQYVAHRWGEVQRGEIHIDTHEGLRSGAQTLGLSVNDVPRAVETFYRLVKQRISDIEKMYPFPFIDGKPDEVKPVTIFDGTRDE